MELKQLRYFVALAEELHFQRAASRLHLTQPSLSYQVKAMEGELDVTLFTRDRKSVVLSEPGQVLYQHAKRILADYDNAILETKAAGGKVPQTINIGMNAYINLPVVTQCIVATRQIVPNATVNFIDTFGRNAFDLVREGELDIGFALMPVVHDALKVKPVIDGFWGVVVPKTHPFAQHDEIDISALHNTPIIMFDSQSNPALYKTCLGYFHQAEVTPNIVFETKQVQTGISMASNGGGVYFVASYIVKDLPPELCCIKLTGFENRLRIGAAWREDNKSKLLQTYLDQLRLLVD